MDIFGKKCRETTACQNFNIFRRLCDIGECHAGIHQLSRIKRGPSWIVVCRGEEEPPPVLKQGPLFIPLVGEYIPSHLFMALEPSALASPLPPFLPTPKCSTTGGPPAHSTAKATHIHTLLYIFLCSEYDSSSFPSLPITHSAYIFLSPRWLGRPYPAHILSAKGGGRGGDGEKWRVVLFSLSRDPTQIHVPTKNQCTARNFPNKKYTNIYFPASARSR